MNKYEMEQFARDEYKDCRLQYNITEDDFYKKSNNQNYEKMKEALNQVGIMLSVENSSLRLSIFPEKYIRAKNRHCGKKKSVAWNNDCSDFFKYSDVVYWIQTLKDPDVAAKLGMPIATYYRHKKALKESDYYKSLDKNRLEDKEYLDSVEGNRIF